MAERGYSYRVICAGRTKRATAVLRVVFPCHRGMALAGKQERMVLDMVNEILRKVKEKRGYLLPYHEVFCSVAPALLEKYDEFYEELTLKTKHLDKKTKELVWLGILISVFEEDGVIHLKRGMEAGITDDEISDVMVLTQVAIGFKALSFVEEKWGSYIPNISGMQIYERTIDKLTRGITIPPQTVELVLIGIYSALSIKRALRFHLVRAKSYGSRDEEIAEAMSYVFIPCGGNVLIKATEVLKESVQSGELKPDSVLKILLADG